MQQTTGKFIATATIILGIAAGALCLPSGTAGTLYRVVTNYPNPFDSRQESTTIVYTLSSDADVSVCIYDLFGERVKTFARTHRQAGPCTVIWDGTDDRGEKVATGGYLCRVEIEGPRAQVYATRKIGVVH
jgi:flagellar hook assembly protein FlgD